MNHITLKSLCSMAVLLSATYLSAMWHDTSIIYRELKNGMIEDYDSVTQVCLDVMSVKGEDCTALDALIKKVYNPTFEFSAEHRSTLRAHALVEIDDRPTEVTENVIKSVFEKEDATCAGQVVCDPFLY